MSMDTGSPLAAARGARAGRQGGSQPGGSRRGGSTWRGRTLPLLAALALALTACTGGDDPAPAPDGDGGAQVQNPDVIVHAADDEPLSLDPAQAEPGEGGESVILQVYERLVEFTPEGPELEPGLATEVPSEDNGMISEDGLTYTFPIRGDVTFHDGSPLTADDVKYSWDRVLEMELPEANAGLLADIITETTVVDESTFEVTLNQPNAAFLNSVVTQSVASVVSEEVVEANGGVTAGEPNEFMQTNPVGTGPYRFTAWNRGENMVFEVNEDYWGEPASLDLRFEIVPDPDVRVLGLRAGDYDSIETDPSFVGDIEGAEGVEVFAGEYLLEPIHIGMNLNIPDGALP
ncbi:MAG TPA: ABC transporter substrate-binding protein, partial [Actinomycetota bacterium]|nr:ABC transporter substrate-binding protein [Actinomycetota bacterium]